MIEQLPKAFLERMKEMLGEEYDAFLKSYEAPRQFGLRVNTLKISVEEFLKQSPFHLTPVPWTKNGFYYEEADRPARHPYYASGLYYLQEPSAMAPAAILPVEPGDYVLDLCAAPGGKATELGARLKGQGMLVANEISASRAKALLRNIELCGIKNSFLTNEVPKNLAHVMPEFFDKVLIDAPCSGEGMFHREPKMIEYWEKRGPEEYVPIQKQLILYGSRMLKPGGKLLYSTCTFSKKEDEEVIQWLLEQNTDMHLISIAPYEGFSKGFGLSECVRIFPHKMSGEGHFLALLEKKSTEQDNTQKQKLQMGKELKLPNCVEEFFALLKFPIDRSCLKLEKERLYLLPNAVKMPKLRYLRTGLLLGEVKKNRFEPSQALAMALKPEHFASCISIDSTDVRCVKYLKGETLDVSDLPCNNKKGWQLVCVERYPLGFGKLSNGILKNKYYAGWRWQ